MNYFAENVNCRIWYFDGSLLIPIFVFLCRHFYADIWCCFFTISNILREGRKHRNNFVNTRGWSWMSTWILYRFQSAAQGDWFRSSLSTRHGCGTLGHGWASEVFGCDFSLFRCWRANRVETLTNSFCGFPSPKLGSPRQIYLQKHKHGLRWEKSGNKSMRALHFSCCSFYPVNHALDC